MKIEIKLLIIIICGVLLLGYATFLLLRKHRKLEEFYKSQTTQFIKNMRKLEIDEHQIMESFLSFNNLKELIQANKRLEKSFKKYKI